MAERTSGAAAGAPPPAVVVRRLRELVIEIVTRAPLAWGSDDKNIIALHGNATLVVIARDDAARFLEEMLAILPEPLGAFVEIIPDRLLPPEIQDRPAPKPERKETQ